MLQRSKAVMVHGLGQACNISSRPSPANRARSTSAVLVQLLLLTLDSGLWTLGVVQSASYQPAPPHQSMIIAASQRVPGASIRALSRVGCRTLALGDDLQQRVPKQKSGSMEVKRERLQLLSLNQRFHNGCRPLALFLDSRPYYLNLYADYLRASNAIN